MRGFTLIELLLTVSIIGILVAAAAPFYTRFYTQNNVEQATIQLLSNFRKAQLYSMLGRQGTGWGVAYSAPTITFFSGNTFATRNTALDEIFRVNSNITISGLTEVEFNRLTGTASATPTVTISGLGNVDTITVNAQGVATR